MFQQRKKQPSAKRERKKEKTFFTSTNDVVFGAPTVNGITLIRLENDVENLFFLQKNVTSKVFCVRLFGTIIIYPEQKSKQRS